MKKKTVIFALSAGLSILTAVPAFASGWQENETGWWYGTNADNSTWYSNGWQWIDGNGDGIAECYYFDGNGYMAANTVIDGSAVDGNGAWTVDGVVQTKQVGGQQNNNELQRWIGIYEKTDNPNCKIEIYDVNENGMIVEYCFFAGDYKVNQKSEHYLTFQNGDITKAYGSIPPEDRGIGYLEDALDIPETYELTAGGNVIVTFAQVEYGQGWLAYNGVYKKTSTSVRTVSDRLEEERRSAAVRGYNLDGTLTKEGRVYDVDGDGFLDVNESSRLSVYFSIKDLIEKKKEKGIHDYDHITDEDILGYTEEQTMDLMVELMR